ncbi:MAG TPA: EamA family transporter [Candidatus Aquicultor sp.]|jgi:drug/metabolite transporter (DMT)-like permease
MSGYVRIAIAAVIWGSIGVIARTINLPVPILTLYRVFFAAVAIFIYIIAKRKLGTLAVGKNIYRIVFMGALLAVNWLAFFYSIKLTSVANTVLLTYTAPIYVAILAPLFLKERLERITIITLIISLIGAVCIASPSLFHFGVSDIPGIMWAFISSITYAVLVILAKPLTERLSVLPILFYEELTCTVVLTPSLFLYHDYTISGATLALLALLGVVHTALAAAFYLTGLRDVKAQHVGIFTYLDPVSAVIFAAAFLGEIPPITTLIGGALIIISGVLLIWVTSQRINAEIVAE